MNKATLFNIYTEEGWNFYNIYYRGKLIVLMDRREVDIIKHCLNNCINIRDVYVISAIEEQLGYEASLYFVEQFKLCFMSSKENPITTKDNSFDIFFFSCIYINSIRLDTEILEAIIITETSLIYKKEITEKVNSINIMKKDYYNKYGSLLSKIKKYLN